MGKFKDYLLNEEIGLGDLGPRIDAVFNSQIFGNQVAGALVHPGWSQSDTSPTHMDAGHDPAKPPVDMIIPSMEREGRIKYLNIKKNPICIRLSDGTECRFTYQEFKKIKGTPELGKNMRVIFQRHPEDRTFSFSKIDSATVLD